MEDRIDTDSQDEDMKSMKLAINNNTNISVNVNLDKINEKISNKRPMSARNAFQSNKILKQTVKNNLTKDGMLENIRQSNSRVLKF